MQLSSYHSVRNGISREIFVYLLLLRKEALIHMIYVENMPLWPGFEPEQLLSSNRRKSMFPGRTKGSKQFLRNSFCVTIQSISGRVNLRPHIIFSLFFPADGGRKLQGKRRRVWNFFVQFFSHRVFVGLSG